MLLPRSILFTIVWLLTGIIAGCVSILAFPLPYLARYRIVMLWNRFVIWWVTLSCGIHFTIIGERNYPSEPYVVLSNHQSAWETIFLQYYFGPISTILKRELLRIPFFGWGLAMLRPIPIDRGSPINALRKVKALGKSRLASGYNVLVFPEGTRIPFGSIGTYARSGADIACSAEVPIVPVAHNAGKYWPKNGLLKLPGTITVVIGKPIPTVGRSSREVTKEVKNWVESEVAKMS